MQFDKPGCFGNAVTYSGRSKTCTECEVVDQCAPAARLRIEELRSLISVEAIIKMAHSEPQKLTARLPETARASVANMTSQQRSTVGILMTLKDPTPLALVKAVIQKLDLPKAEAIALGKETVNLLVKDRLVDLKDGIIVLRFKYE